MSAYDADRATPWGIAAHALHERIKLAMPAVEERIGGDESTEHGAPPQIEWTLPKEAKVVAPLRTGSKPRWIYDYLASIAVEIWGSSPEEAWEVHRRLLLAVNALHHGRYSELGAVAQSHGQRGLNGSKLTQTITLRLPVRDDEPRRATALTNTQDGEAFGDPAETPEAAGLGVTVEGP